jgi:hypothetical protein
MDHAVIKKLLGGFVRTYLPAYPDLYTKDSTGLLGGPRIHAGVHSITSFGTMLAHSDAHSGDACLTHA